MAIDGGHLADPVFLLKERAVDKRAIRPFAVAVLLLGAASAAWAQAEQGPYGEYFDNMDFTNRTGTRYETVPIDFDSDDTTPDNEWETNDRPENVGLTSPDSFSIRWRGELQIATGGEYYFFLTSDDGSRLWIDGVMVVDNWGDHGAQERQGNINLSAGRHPFMLLYYENGSRAMVKLQYQGPDTSNNKVVVPIGDPQNPTTPGLYGRLAEPPPTITTNGGRFDLPAANPIVMSTSVPGGQIYYTLDGSDPGPHVPSASAILYTGGASGITLPEQRVILVARVYAPGYIPSDPTVPITLSPIYPAVTPTNTTQGVYYKYYYNTWGNYLPNFDPLTPEKRGLAVTANSWDTNNSLSGRDRDTNFGFEFTGYVNIPNGGIWDFWIDSDDGSKLFIHDGTAWVEVANFDGPHGMDGGDGRSGRIGLAAGWHPIKVQMSQGTGGYGLEVRWEKIDEPTQARALIPATALCTEALTAIPQITPAGGNFATSVDVTITSSTPGAVIYYTTDGTAPDPRSANGGGTSPVTLTLTRTTTLRAVALAPGYNPSMISKAVFTRTDLPPDLLEVTASGPAPFNRRVTVVFDQNVDPTTAQNPSNYTITYSGGTVSVIGANLIQTQAVPPVCREVWTGISGTAVSNLTSNPAYPNSPSIRESTIPANGFEAPTNWADNYGTRMRAFFIPPESGNWTFYIASDDSSELWLSLDEKASNATRIAYVNGWTGSKEWLKNPSQKSAPVPLAAGMRYYIEALQKEGGGGDNLAVRAVLTDSDTTKNGDDPIPAANLQPYSLTYADTVVLTLGSDLTTGIVYTLKVVNVRNAAGQNPIPADPGATMQFKYFSAGPVWRETFDGISGSAITDLTNNAKYPNDPSSGTGLDPFEFQNYGDNYGSRIRGYFYPDKGSTNYYFAIASDDPSRLYLSTDDSPRNKVQISWVNGWTGYREYTNANVTPSGPIFLKQYNSDDGYRYYIETLHKEGSGGDHVAVTGNLSGTFANGDPALGNSANTVGELSPYVAPLKILQQPVDRIVQIGQQVTFRVVACGSGWRQYQWYKDGEPIPLATSSTYTIAACAEEDSGDYHVVITNPVNTVTSNVAFLVVSDTTPPQIARVVAAGDLNKVQVVFTKRMDKATAENPSNYTISPPLGVVEEATVQSAALQTDGRTVILALQPGQTLCVGDAYTITVNGVRDRCIPPNTIPTNSSYVFIPSAMPSFGLTGYWKLDDGAGLVAADSSGGGHDGTLVSGPMTWVSTPVAQHRGAIQFGGGSGYVWIPFDASETEFTVALWFKTTEYDGGLFAIVDGPPELYPAFDRCLYLSSGQIIAEVLPVGEAFSDWLQTEETYNDGAWHHVALVFGGLQRGAKLFVDGQLKCSGSAKRSGFDWDMGAVIGWGTFNLSTPYFNGTIDDVRVYNRALSNEEILALTNTNMPPEVTAGPDFKVPRNATTSMKGQVLYDDGRPGDAALQWIVVDKPAGSTVTWNPTPPPYSATHGVSFDTEGIYLLRLKADDGEYHTCDFVTVEVVQQGAVPTVQFREVSSSGWESAGTVNVEVTLSWQAAGTVTVPFAVGGSATGGGTDYSLLPASPLVFNPGETSKIIQLTVNDDSDVESDETVVLTLQTPTGATLGSPSQYTYTIRDNDGPPIAEFRLLNSQVVEGDGTPENPDRSIEVEVVLSWPHATEAVTVGYQLTGGTAEPGVDFNQATAEGTVQIPAGETSRTFTVHVYGDTVDEPNETIQISLWFAVNGVVGPRNTHVVTILDDDLSSQVSFATASSSGPENASPAEVEVVLSAPSSTTVTVNYAVLPGGTATGGGVDYTLGSGTVSFGPGEVSKKIQIPIVNDQIDEDDETILLSLSAPVNAVLGSVTGHTFTIVDDDLPPTVAFGQAAMSAPESYSGGTVPVNIPVVLSSPSARAVSVSYNVTGGTATGGGVDYSLPESGVLNFSPGQVVQYIQVLVVQDDAVEANETIVFTLSNPGNAELGSLTTHTLTILDDDTRVDVCFDTTTSTAEETVPTVQIPVSLRDGDGNLRASGNTVTVTYVIDPSSTATAGQDYVAPSGTLVFNPGETTKNITITILDDTIYEPSETLILTITGVTTSPMADKARIGAPATHTHTITSDEAVPVFQILDAEALEAGDPPGKMRFTIRLTSPVEQATWVQFSTSDVLPPANGRATENVDYTPRTNAQVDFAAFETSKTIEIDITNDTTSEPDEIFLVRLVDASDPSLINIGNGAVVEATGTILNDDNQVYVDMSTPPSVAEGGQLQFTVKLDQKKGWSGGPDITVRVAPADGTAMLGQDYQNTGFPIELTFMDGQTQQTVAVQTVQDALYENPETVLLVLSNPTNAVLGTPNPGTGTITNDDPMPTVSFTAASGSGPEATANPTIAVKLDTQSGVDTVVDVAAGGTATLEADYTFLPPSVAASLRGYWKLDDANIGAGCVADSSGRGHTGSHVNDPVRDTTQKAALPFTNLSSLRFERSTSDYVTIPDAPGLNVGTGDFTVALWIRTADTSRARVINKWYGSGPDYGWLLDVHANGTSQAAGYLRFRMNDDVHDLDTSINAGIAANTWYHVAVRVDRMNNRVRFFLNGAPIGSEVSSSAVTGSLDTPQPVGLGTIPSAVGTYFDGWMDDVRLYAAALTDAQIAAIAATTAAARVVIPALQTTAAVPITILNDTMDEDDEEVILTLQNPVNATLGTPSQHTYTIVDDDAAPSVSFVSASYNGQESVATVDVQVALSGASGRTISVPFTVAGTAASPDDFTVVTASPLVFNPGETSKIIRLNVVNDALDENSETVELTLGAPTNATLGTIQVHTYTILDDDAEPTVSFALGSSSVAESVGTVQLQVNLSTASGRTVQVAYSVAGGTASGDDYTLESGTLNFEAGETSKTIDLAIVPDDLDEEDETVIVALSGLVNCQAGAILSHTVTILDDDAPPSVSFQLESSQGGEAAVPLAQLEVRLSGPSGKTVTVDYAPTGGTATGGGVDYSLLPATLTFDPGDTIKFILLGIMDDPYSEADETVMVTLSNPVNASLGTVPSHTYTIVDNDPKPVVSFIAASSGASESTPSVNLVVSLSGTSGMPVTVPFTVSGSAVSPDDYTVPTPSPLSFAVGETSKSITISLVDDLVDEDDETVVVTLGDPTGATLGSIPVHTLTISDNDTAGFVVTPTSGLVTTESGGTAQFTVRLVTRPTADVTIGLSSSNPGEGTVSPSSLTFTPANWNVVQTVTVTGVNDDAQDGAVGYTIVTAPDTATADLKYRNLNPPDVSVTNMDNDTAGIVVAPTGGLTTTEAGGTATFTIVLTAAPQGSNTVTIALSSSDTTEGTVAPSQVVFDSGNWNLPVTVTVTGVDDFVDDGDVVYTIRTAPAVSGDAVYHGMNAADVTVVNRDDDTAGVTVAPTGGLVTKEAGDTATFTVKLDSQPTAAVTLTVTSSDPTEGLVSTAGSPTPGSTKTLTFTTGNWNVAQVVTVHGVNDAVRDGAVAYVIVTGAASSWDAKYNGLDPADVGVVNEDDDVAGILVNAAPGLETTEAGGRATFTVVLRSQPTASVTIPVWSSDPTEGTVSPGSLTFTPSNWNVAQTVTVTGVNDQVADGDVAYTVVLGPAQSADPDYQGRDPSDVGVVNRDDDVAGIVVSPTGGLVTTESGGKATFYVRLSSQPVADVVVPVVSGDGTEGVATPGTLTFTAGNWNVNQAVVVSGVDDWVDDGDVAYVVNVGPASSGDVGYNGRTGTPVGVVNRDNDTAGIVVSPTTGLVTSEGGRTATFTVVLKTEPTAEVRIGLSSTDATEGTVSPNELVFTSANWNVPQVVVVTGVDDVLADGAVEYWVVTAPAVSEDPVYGGMDAADVRVVNQDNDTAGVTVAPTGGLETTEGGGTAVFEVVLNTQPTADVVINLSSSDLTEGMVTPSSLTFTPANWNVPQVVVVSGVDDPVADGDVSYWIVTAPAVSTDANYNGRNGADVLVVNRDNDVAGIRVSPVVGLETTEGGGTAWFEVVLETQPTAGVTVAVATSNGKEGLISTEGSPTPGSTKTLTFTTANWNVAQKVTVHGVDDAVADGDVAYTVVVGPVSSFDAVYRGIDPADVLVVNRDNDVAGVTVSPTTGLGTTEAGGTATFTVVLDTVPTANVRIPLSVSNPAEGTVTPTSLTFTPSNARTPQTVTVKGLDDFTDDGNVTYTIFVGPAESSDPAYAGLGPREVTVTNQDNDTAGIMVSPTTGLVTTEAGGQATFSIVLLSQPAADVTVPLAVSDDTEGAVSPSWVTFTPDDWNVPQTVTVTGVDDFLDDGNVAYQVLVLPALSPDPLYSGLDGADVSVTNRDDDTAGITVWPTTGLVTSESGGQAFFTVVLASQPTADVTISLTSSNPAEGTVWPASLTFTPSNWDVAQVVVVTGQDDDAQDGAVAYTIVTGAAVSADPAYNGRDPADVGVVNADNDTAGITVAPVGGLETTEGGGTAEFVVVLNTQPSADVSITVSTSNAKEGLVSTAASPVPGTSKVLTFTGTDWYVPQVVTVTGVDDFVDDGDVVYTIRTHPASSADANYRYKDAADVTVTNLDDDVAGIAVSATSGLVTTEAGGTATFTVVLQSRPTATVTIPLSSSDTTEGTVSPSSLVFYPTDWNVPKTVTVTGVNDDLDDGDVAYTIFVGPSVSTDPRYNGIDPPDVSVVNADNDTAGIVVNPTSGLTTTETGGSATFTVRLQTRPLANVTIGLSSNNPSEGTVSPSILTFTPTNWNTSQTVRVTGVDDFVDDGNVAYKIVLAPASSADPSYNGLVGPEVSVTNTDNDTWAITVSPTSGLVTTEAGGTASFTIVLGSQPTADVTIPLSSSNPGEGVPSPSAVVFTPSTWNVPQRVTVTGVDDFVDDGTQAYTIVTGPAVSADPVYNGKDPTDVLMTNQNNDTAGITVFPTTGLVTSEAGGQATFTVVLNSRPTADVSLLVTSNDPTEGLVSTASDPVPAVSKTLTFTPAAWNVPQVVTVVGQDDSLVDGYVSYAIVTGAASSADPKYNGIDPPNVAVTNTDNDQPGITVAPTAGLVTTEAGGTAVFTVVLNTQPTASVTINLTSSDTTEGTVSPSSLVFSPQNWSVPQTVTVRGVDDGEADGDVSFTVVTAPAVSTDPNYSGRDAWDVEVVNRDDDAAGITVSPTSGLTTTEAGGTATFTVVLTSVPAADVTIALSSSNPAEGTVSPPSLTFTPANALTPQVVTVTGVDDSVQDGDAVYTIVLGAASSTDTRYSGVDPADVSVTNLDNDTAGIVVTPTSGLTTTEGGGTATFTVRLASRPSADVTIALSSSNPAEGTVSPASLTFTSANWNTSQTVTVTGVDDPVADGAVTYLIVLSPAVSADPLYSGLDGADVTVVNTDNDTAGFTVSPTTGLTTTEAGGTATFTVVLNTRPSADVTVPLASSNPREGVVSPSSLVFTPENWNVPQVATVRGVDDTLIDGNVAYTILLGRAVSADPRYNGLDPADVSVTNSDDDAAGIAVYPTAGLVTAEYGGQATFTMVLTAIPTADVTIGLSSSDTTEGTVYPSSVTFTPATWNIPRVVTVTGVDDLLPDGNQNYTILTAPAVSADPNFNGVNPADVSVVNVDNETPGITVSAMSGHTSESGINAYFQVVLNTVPSADVTLTVESQDTTEGRLYTDDDPVDEPSKTLVFTPENALVPHLVWVIGQDDTEVDGDITYQVVTSAASSTDGSYDGINPPDVTVTNDDDEEAGVQVTPTSGLVTTEGGGSATFTMVLNAQPAANVTITLSSSDPTEGTVSPTTVTFTPANWNVPQTVTVTGVDDAITDGDVLYWIITSNTSSADPVFNNRPVPDVSVTNMDNDVPGFTVVPTTGLTTTEAGGTASFTVRLNTQPAANVQIPISSSDPTEGTVSTALLTFTPGNWNVPQTVVITGVDDAVDDGNVVYTIVTGDPTSADPVYDAITADQVPDVTVTNIDNDTAVVTGIFPNRGPISGGQTVTISGTTLAGATSVDFGGSVVLSGSFVENTDTRIVLVTPSHAAGPVTVTVNFPGGNPTTSYTYIDPATVADLSVTKTASPAAPTLGANVEFTVTVLNTGQQPAGGVVVTDLLPAGLTYVSHAASQGTYDRFSGLWNVGSLASGSGTATLSVLARLDTASPVTNTAEVTAMSSPSAGDLDSTPGNHDPTEDDQASVTLSAALDIQTTSLPGGTVGAPYDQTLQATGGVTPYRWSIASGALPPGLGINPDTGRIYGTATTAGTYNFTARVTDANSPAGSDTQALSIVISPAGGTLTITSTPPGGTVGVAYDFTFTATGGTPPYTWSRTLGSFPTGLSLDGSTGRLAGTPVAAGTFNFTIQVSGGGTATQDCSVIILPNPVTITTLTLPDGSVGSAYSQPIQATGGVTPFSWTVVSGALPTGLALSGTGRTATLSGTPTAAGTFNFTVQAEDDVGTTDTQYYTVVIAPAGQPLAIAPLSLAPATVGGAYPSIQLTATGGTPPYTGWVVKTGSLPAGMSLSAAGALSGTPTEAGVFGFIVEVSDSAVPTPATDTQDFSLVVNPAPAIITASPLPNGAVGSVYFVQLETSGGTAPLGNWTVSSGSLPAGLGLDPSSGVISGTPAAAGTSNFTVRVTDANGVEATKDFTLTIVSSAALAVVTSQLPRGEVGVPYSATLQAVGGSPPYDGWSVIGGILPSWAVWDAATGTISGTPTAAGTTAGLVFRVADGALTADSAAMTLEVLAPLEVVAAGLPAGSLMAPYSAMLSTSGAVAPVQWTVVSGALPGGLSLDPATGAISGQPVAPGTFVFRVRATDGAGRTAERQFTITILIEVGGSRNRECFLASVSERPASSGGGPGAALAAAAGVLLLGMGAARARRARRGFVQGRG